MKKLFWEFIPGLIGGALGGVAGYFFSRCIMSYGREAPLVPGALVGLGCGILSRSDSRARGVVCAIEALVIGLYIRFLLFDPPFEYDGSFIGYLSHVPELPGLTLVMLGIGAAMGFWWGRERILRPKVQARPTES
jgi:hypothetical protein